ncbi:tRNA (adenosine(37)-N6)-threonylcarbamoyltransferase complex ATPase subunit type 1 TsaE [Acidiphilium iwatense]|uniref:tRNA threonylcarbamoyladenosine biosynthesis protein TsaE n=1 Tax=Acidiphilium iwatense TaxID=768198 RepID=A0ABS9DXQ4_9PROT|nr:tRNA (adenosine(37)-N6)-threonylcarbamoyltransferase complex ATPase subunit type 1 TsaE [Acidiphilium iwatense]MCF3947522.1 tRNA (adenosine(37)-N6)-threonylcarbamoyltransferase complex ATPase subunit type 1 TsaE [Acidiphilium iwatense]
MAIRTILLHSEAETVALARELAARATAGDAVLLTGPLGAGKSTLARAFIRARAGDPALDVPSPSFTLVQSYDLDPPIAHFDLWRLGGPDEVAELGFETALAGIALVEWPEKLGPLAPRDALTITLAWGNGEIRHATLDGPERLVAGAT